jgi:hypothetical protein
MSILWVDTSCFIHVFGDLSEAGIHSLLRDRASPALHRRNLAYVSVMPERTCLTVKMAPIVLQHHDYLVN